MSEETHGEPKAVINSAVLEKFQALQKRRLDISKKSTEKRIKEIQIAALERVAREFGNDDDAKLLHETTVSSHSKQLPPSGTLAATAIGSCASLGQSLVDCNEKSVNHLTGEDRSTSSVSGQSAGYDRSTSSATHQSAGNGKSTSSTGGGQSAGYDRATGTTGDQQLGSERLAGLEQEWQTTKQYMNINSHLYSACNSRDVASTKLEQKLNEAIALGEFDAADAISERLAARDFGEKVSQAFDARRFTEKRKKEELQAVAKRRKRLHWGFNHKERWETKGNM